MKITLLIQEALKQQASKRKQQRNDKEPAVTKRFNGDKV